MNNWPVKRMANHTQYGGVTLPGRHRFNCPGAAVKYRLTDERQISRENSSVWLGLNQSINRLTTADTNSATAHRRLGTNIANTKRIFRQLSPLLNNLQLPRKLHHERICSPIRQKQTKRYGDIYRKIQLNIMQLKIPSKLLLRNV